MNGKEYALQVSAPPMVPDKAGFEIKGMGLVVTGKPSFQEWQIVGAALRHEFWEIARRDTLLRFAIGDWLEYGQAAYGEKYSQALTETDYTLGTLQNFAYVARNVKPSLRRESLTYKHHAAVAMLDEDKQAAMLDQAEAEQWSANALIEHVQAERGGRMPHIVLCPNCGAQFEP